MTIAPLAASPAAAQATAPLPCDGQFYGMQGGNSLYRINFATNPFTYTPMGGPTPFTYNALGFNHRDGFLYGIDNSTQPRRVVRFDAGGNWSAIPTAAPLPTLPYLNGAFLPNGNYVIAGPALEITVLDVATSPATVVSSAAAAAGLDVRDFAVSPVDGQIYGFDDNSTRLVRINPSTGSAVLIGATNPGISTVGSAWFDAFGRFYGYGIPPGGGGNQTTFYQADVGAGGPGSLGQLVPLSTGPATVQSDGASCPFGVQMNKTVSPTTVQAGETVTYSYAITNRSAVLQRPTFTDCLCDDRTFTGVVVNPFNGAITFGPGNTMRISDMAIPAGGTGTITAQVQVPASATSGTAFNQAQLANLTLPAPASILSDFPGTPGPDDRTPLQVIATPPPVGTDLAVDKSGPAEVRAGDTFQYTISVSNVGSATAAGATLVDTLPGGFVLVSATGGASVTGSVVTWSLGALQPGQAVTQAVVVRAPTEAGSAVNTATVTSSSDPIPGNNTDTVTTAVRGVADLTVDKAGPASAPANAEVTYTVTVSNNGPSTAVGASATDTLPAGFTFVAASNGGGQTSPGVVRWDLGNVPPGATLVRSVMVRAPSNGTTATNSASVTSSTDDPNLANNADSVTTAMAGSADLSVETSGPPQVSPNADVPYTITVSNAGPSTAANATLTDTLPAGFGLVSASDGGSATAPGVVTWNLSDMSPGLTVTRTIVLRAPAEGGPATNAAVASSPTSDPNPANNRAEVATMVVATANLSVDKSGPAEVDAGQTATYTVTVRNAGPSTAAGTVATDTLPGGLTFVSASDGGTQTSPGVMSWDLGNLGPNGIATRTIVVRAPNEATTLTNVATVATTTLDPDSADNRDEAAITVVAVADLAIDKSGPAEVLATATATYTIAFTNNGPSTATGVQLREAIPTGFTFVSASDGGALTSPGVVTWNVGTLASGTGGQRSIVLRAPSEAATATDEAGVSAATADRNEANNTDTITTRVIAVTDMGIDKTGPAEVDAAQPITYTLSVTNNGPSTAEGVVVSDVLPAGVSFVSASDGGIQSSPGTVTWALGTVSPAATRSVTITGQAPNEAAMLANSAHVDSSTPDPSAGNDDDSVTTRVIPVADLVVDKSAPGTVEAGENLAYTIVVTNSGPSTAANVVVTDQMDAGFVFVSADNGGTVTGPGLVTWNMGPMAPGVTRTVTLTATAPLRVFTSTNRARVASETTDRNPSDNNDAVETRVVDTTPPVTACAPTTNPAGKNVPGNSPPGQVNPDGFFILTAVDRVDPSPTVTLTDTASGTVFGPFPSGTRIKLIQSPGGKPSQKPGPGVIDWEIRVNGGGAVRGTDFSGNVSAPVLCSVPPGQK